MQNDMMLSSSTDEQLENERKERRMDERRRVGKEEEEVSETASKAGTWSVILGAEMSCYSDKTHCSHSGLMPEGPPNTGPDNQARGGNDHSWIRSGPVEPLDWWSNPCSLPDPFQGLLQERLRWTSYWIPWEGFATRPWSEQKKESRHGSPVPCSVHKLIIWSIASGE
ncbi:Hydrolase FUB4 [Fusarium oxysporum f. sp. albedinis]|nr:Hydrolase FUB4 [Fusarium oxysporum f. sp. albedinis]